MPANPHKHWLFGKFFSFILQIHMLYFSCFENTMNLGGPMERLTICQERSAGFTAVSNYFIDVCMCGANDAQIKVYLYLLRMFQANMSTSISDIADVFNHTEKDVLRSLQYWEKKHLLALDYDASRKLAGIRLLPASGAAAEENHRNENLFAVSRENHIAEILPHPAAQAAIPAEPAKEPDPYEKPSYSLDELKAFRSREDVGQLLFIVEQYIGKTLSANDIRTILFIQDRLGFSKDLIDYLVQYCVDRGKRDFRYIEKVAINWAQENITTPKQAKAMIRKYDKTVYTIMKALGKDQNPTPREVTYITTWTKDFGLPLAVIEVACERTVSATDKHRFEYADSILKSWNESNVRSLEDIKAADAAFQKGKASGRRTASNAPNQFTQFEQRDYDFDALEQALRSN